MSVSSPRARSRWRQRMGSERGATRMVQGRKWGVVDRVVFGIRWDDGRRPRQRVVFGLLAAVSAALVPASAQASAVDAGSRAGLRSVFVMPAAGRAADARTLVCRLGGHDGARIAVARGFVARVPANRIKALRSSSAVRTAAPDVALSVRGDDAAQTAATAGETLRAAS